ncbi:MAG: CPBP family glutamic-type intramembrane protease [Bacteroidota bacterium]
MRKFIGYFRQFFKEDFHWPTYLAVAIALTAYIIFNYQTRFEYTNIYKHMRSDTLVWWLFGYYAANYFGACLLVAIMRREWHWIKNPKFWMFGILATGLLAFDTGFIYHHDWLRAHAPVELRYWLGKIISNTISIVTHLIPLFFIWKLLDRKTENFYGLTVKNVDWKLYWTMLGFMAVLVGLASFHPSFYEFYPIYKPRSESEFLQVPIWLTNLAFELAYGFDFITVEHMLRGFMVIGMAQIMGPRAVVPMAALYCTYHFSKPAGEAISSIFGGYILGVIALYSRNVWGGVFVHMGIAWLMEIAAYIQNYFRN